MILEGSISVKAALLGRHRNIQTIYIDEKRHDKETAFIIARADDAEVPVNRVSRESIDAMAQ